MRVLVVEDEAPLARSLKKGLEWDGFAVDLAADGTDGLWMARENTYDAIVLDLMLPGIDGYQVCAALRAEHDWTPILILTALDDELDQTFGLDSGADDYVVKPFSHRVLVARLHALVRRGVTERPAALEVAGLQLDPATRQVSCDGTPLVLTAREVAVLEYLMRHAGRVISKREVLDHVWDDDFEGDPNIVEVYVLRLRRKIDRAGGPGMIQTVRGAGYRLAASGG